MATTKTLRWGVLRSLAIAFRTATRLAALPRLVWATVRGQYVGTSRARLIGIAFALLYVVSPIDLLPEMFLPFVGLADDAVVITWIAASLINETESFLGWEGDRARTVRGNVVA